MPARPPRSALAPKGTNGPAAPVPSPLVEALLAECLRVTPRRVLVPLAGQAVELVEHLSRNRLVLDIAEGDETQLVKLTRFPVHAAIGQEFENMEPQAVYDVVVIGILASLEMVEQARKFLALGGRVVFLARADGKLPEDSGSRATAAPGLDGVAIVVIPNRGA